jgi:hypothetical protein
LDEVARVHQAFEKVVQRVEIRVPGYEEADSVDELTTVDSELSSLTLLGFSDAAEKPKDAHSRPVSLAHARTSGQFQQGFPLKSLISGVSRISRSLSVVFDALVSNA